MIELGSYVCSRDFNRLLRVAEQIDQCRRSVRWSQAILAGLGREGGTEGITEYNTIPYIGIADPYPG